MVYQLLGLENISVGAPYFNSLIFPVSVLTLVALAFMPTLKWIKGTSSCAERDVLISITVSTVS
nr:cytochrome c-type biogenesis CcmF C-terminal domain-containing protein [Vibrio campbellii]